MVTPDNSLDIHHAGRDISSGSIYVEGEVAAGQAACLVPRRYRKRPDWWVIDVVSIDAPTGAPQQFRLACDGDGLWGTAGIEIVGPSSSVQIPRQEASSVPEPTQSSKSGGPAKLGSGSAILSSKSGKLNSKSREARSAPAKLNMKLRKLASKARRVSSTKSPNGDS